MDVTFWRAAPPPGFFLIGDYVQGNYGAPTETIVVVRDAGTGGTPALAPLTGYVQIYNDRGTGAGENGAIWMPTAPVGYVALGAVTTREYAPPSTEMMRCVRFDLVVPGRIGGLIWNDRKSGGANDVSVYAIEPQGDGIAAGTFYAQGNCAPPSGTAYCLRPAIVKGC